MRFRTAFNYEMETPFQSELASETVPDQSLTIREIITKYVRDGVPPPGNELAFSGPNFQQNIKTMDLSEIHELKIQLQEKITALEQQYRTTQNSEPDAGAERQGGRQEGGGGTTTTPAMPTAATPSEGSLSSDKIQQIINLLTK